MITFTSLGNLGRLGNQLFQIASTIGIALKNNQHCGFNEWPYQKYFVHTVPQSRPVGMSIREKNYNHDDYTITNDCDLAGYFQSYKYFDKAIIKEQFKFQDDFFNRCVLRLPDNGKKNIAIHVRRGDYVGNPSHYQLTMNYYLQAIQYMPKWWECNLIFFSDDQNFCRWHFGCLPNAYFMSGGSDIEDLCTMSKCHHFIIANSSFSWWSAYLGETNESIVVRPHEHFTGSQLRHDIKDLYPENWIVKSNVQKVDITDMTFVIPIHYDHNDRAANLNLCVYHLQSVFNTNIHVIEQGSKRFSYTSDFAKYTLVDYDRFHRTKMLNDVFKEANTPFVANYDADVLLNPVQIWYAVHLLRRGCDIVYPYDGNFKHIPRAQMPNVNTSLYWLIGRKLEGPICSYGGAVFGNKSTYMRAGGENENFIAFGPEDAERYTRFIRLGLYVIRVAGPLYHLDHYRGINSSKSNPHITANRAESRKVHAMSESELFNYIKTWSWNQHQ